MSDARGSLLKIIMLDYFLKETWEMLKNKKTHARMHTHTGTSPLRWSAGFEMCAKTSYRREHELHKWEACLSCAPFYPQSIFV